MLTVQILMIWYQIRASMWPLLVLSLELAGQHQHHTYSRAITANKQLRFDNSPVLLTHVNYIFYPFKKDVKMLLSQLSATDCTIGNVLHGQDATLTLRRFIRTVHL